MNSIFLRIYGGMLSAMVLIAFFSYLAFVEINDYRSSQFRESMAKGPMLLIADGVAKHTGDYRERWLAAVSRLMGVKFSAISAEDTDLGASDLSSLARGNVLVRLDAGDEFADLYVKVPEENLYVTARMNKVAEQQARAVAVLLLDRLGKVQPEQWRAELQTLQPNFAFSIQAVPISSLDLEQGQIDRLKRREVVVSLLEQGEFGSLYVYALLTNELVLQLGPLNLFDPYPLQLIVLNGLFALCMIALTAYLLVRPLRRRLKVLEKAVKKLSEGDLAARVVVDSSDAVGQLASRFNRMAEHIQRLLVAQKEMTRAVSHELRTPVARIRFGLEILADEPDQVQRDVHRNAIDRDIEELDKLIDEILTYAKLEQETPVLDIAEVDLSALAGQVRDEFSALHPNVKIIVEDTDSIFVEGEGRYIHRVLQNYVSNALRYCENHIYISMHPSAGFIRIDVEDDGPGIAKEKWEKVFEPFSRLDDSRTRSSGGYGLGLSIVRRIADWHGGKARVGHSIRLGGARFSFLIPQNQIWRDADA